jgi:hypothetical protein
MPGIPFFRGQNRMDWLFAVMLQTACDWGTDEEIQSVAQLLGFERLQRYGIPASIGPPVTLVYTPSYLFVVASSTRGAIQWVGNVLGSVASSVPPAHGTVSTYFGAIASWHYKGIRNDVLAGVESRRLVLVGFSLGGASVTILKDMLLRADGVASACITFGVPRPGTTTFADGFPSDDHVGFGVINDPVPSVPPIVWAGQGLHNDWIPFPPYVEYSHVSPGFTLFLDGSISPGFTVEPVDQVILGFDTGLFKQFHNQPLYGSLLRTGLPSTISDGYEGFPHAGLLDQVAAEVFSIGSQPWRWLSSPTPPAREFSMGCQLAFYIRDKASPPLGFQEIYYFPGDDPSVPFNAALASSGNWITKRAKFLSSSCEIYALRCSHVGTPKKSYLSKFKVPVVGDTQVTETIEDCVTYFGFSPGRSVKRQFHFRGVDSRWITADKLTTSGNSGQLLIVGSGTAFLNTLMAAGLSMLAGSGETRENHRIQSAAKATQSDPITLTLADTYAPAPGTLIDIRGCREAPLLNGRWQTIGAASAGSIKLSGSARYSAPASLSGYVSPVVPTLFAVEEVMFSGVGSKKTGRPSFLQRGRQSAKLRHR